jgi:hypothetical protein
LSQINYYAVSPKYGRVDVQTGWDRPLQHFHVTIFDANPPGLNEEDSDQEHIVFCDIEAGKGPVRDASDVIAILDHYEVPIPPGLEGLLSAHRKANAGNLIVNIAGENFR